MAQQQNTTIKNDLFFHLPLTPQHKLVVLKVLGVPKTHPRCIKMYKNAVLETLMLGKIEGKEEKRVTEDEMLGWLKLNGYE